MIDFATGFPAAVPLKDVDFISVVEALLGIFDRVGIPREILSDRGAQFTSQFIGELHKLLSVKLIFTTLFHSAVIERLHGPLEAGHRKLCAGKPQEWQRHLVPKLFAFREIPSDSMSFSSFELLPGRAERGPLVVLRDLRENWTIQNDERSCF